MLSLKIYDFKPLKNKYLFIHSSKDKPIIIGIRIVTCLCSVPEQKKTSKKIKNQSLETGKPVTTLFFGSPVHEVGDEDDELDDHERDEDGGGDAVAAAGAAGLGGGQLRAAAGLLANLTQLLVVAGEVAADEVQGLADLLQRWGAKRLIRMCK